MPSSDRGDEPRRLSVGGESRIVDVSSSTAWTGGHPTPPRAATDVPVGGVAGADDAVAAGDVSDTHAMERDAVASELKHHDTPAADSLTGAADPEAVEPLTVEPAVDEPGAAEPEAPGSVGAGPEATAATGSDEFDDRGGESATAAARAAQLAAIAAASVAAADPSAGNTTVLVRDAIPAGAEPAPADAGVVYVGSRRTERLTMIASTVLGTLGLLLAVASAGLDQVRYDQPAPCAAYATAHKGSVAFGCTATAKHIAVLLPAIGIPLLVLLALVVVWVPNWLPKARFRLLGGLFLVLLACGAAVALAYSALPKVS